MAENYLIGKSFNRLYLFRSGYIYPVAPREEPNFSYRLMRTLYPLIKLFGKNASVKSTELSLALFNAGLQGTDKMVLENKDILLFNKSA